MVTAGAACATRFGTANRLWLGEFASFGPGVAHNSPSSPGQLNPGQSNPGPASREAGEEFFLPDFCGIRMVFAVVIIAELLSFVLALAPLEAPPGERWRELGLISLFVQWAALSSSAVLCLARPFLRRRAPVVAALFSYFIMLLVLAAVTEGAFWIMQAAGAGHSAQWHAHFMIRNLSMGAIINALVLRYFYVQHQWRHNVRAESQARLQALQARIRPHFLFNSMNTIASLTRSRPEEAETVVENLADLFRMSLSDERQRIRLGEELALCRRYLHIEALRLGERLSVVWDLADDLPEAAMIPPLTLQPLLENAIYHGIEPRTEGGTVRITGRYAEGRLSFTIDNPLPVTGTSQRPRSGNRLALANIRERLLAHYGNQAGVEMGEHADGFRVQLYLPCVMEGPV